MRQQGHKPKNLITHILAFRSYQHSNMLRGKVTRADCRTSGNPTSGQSARGRTLYKTATTLKLRPKM
jgi:hypothetical protein